MRFRDRVAIITGGARGMGRALALGFAREGGSVAVADLTPEDELSVLDDVERAGGQGLYVQADVSLAADCHRMASATLDRFGRVDIAVTCAGIHLGAVFVEESQEMWDRLFQVNVMGTVLALQAVVPQMMEQKWGRIVIVSSKAATTGEPYHAAYSASKGAVLSLTRGLAVELAPYDITVNAICPGPTYTDLTKVAFSDPAVVQGLEAATPLGCLGTPMDQVGAVLYFASDEASWCTGQALAVDGGSSIGNRA